MTQSPQAPLPAQSPQAPLPPALEEIAEDFNAMTAGERLQLLLEFSDGLPELPDRYLGHSELMEQVPECQSPLFLAVELDASEGGAGTVHLYFDAPRAAPTTRGFAGILHAGLDGLSAADLLSVPDDAPYRFGLGEAVSPLRLRGMVSMLGRIKRQVRDKAAA
ncbi:MAG: SufE family protein [Actinomycetales bacterium]